MKIKRRGGWEGWMFAVLFGVLFFIAYGAYRDEKTSLETSGNWKDICEIYSDEFTNFILETYDEVRDGAELRVKYDDCVSRLVPLANHVDFCGLASDTCNIEGVPPGIYFEKNLQYVEAQIEEARKYVYLPGSADCDQACQRYHRHMSEALRVLRGGSLDAVATPTPYPEGVSGKNTTLERCEEYRYIKEDWTAQASELWIEEIEDWAGNWEMIVAIIDTYSLTVASHTCSLYDHTFDEDAFWWSQNAYHLLDVLEHRFWDEKYSQ